MPTFYLKYRPQTVEELDLDSVREQLRQVLQSKAVPHAFLFAGPRGLGKTSAARILAKAINCTQYPASSIQQKKERKKTPNSSFEPCNKCDICQAITEGRTLDVIEIDGASNRGIDDIRQLKEQIKISPSVLAKKIYVIDEVHMLTKEAFNALLKTLEEPPDHAIFVLATTEPEKLPLTIVSRCFVIRFNHPSEKEIKRALLRVSKAEKLKIEENILDLIAKRSEGSFRDAVKMLEQLSFAGKEIDKKRFDSIFENLNETVFLKSLSKKDISQSLSFIDKANEAGADWKAFLYALLSKLRDKLLAKYGVGDDDPDFSETELKEMIGLFLKAGSDLKNAPIPHLPIEIAVIDFCSNKNQQPGENNRIIEQSSNNKTKKIGSPIKTVCDISKVQEKWEEVLKAVKPQNHSIEALLKSARPIRVEGNTVVVEVFYEFHKGRLETEKCREIVEGSLKQVLNIDKIRVEYVLGEKKTNSNLGRESGMSSKSRGSGGGGEENQAQGEADETLVKTAEEIFG